MFTVRKQDVSFGTTDGEFKDSFKQTKMIVIMIDWIYTVRF